MSIKDILQYYEGPIYWFKCYSLTQGPEKCYQEYYTLYEIHDLPESVFHHPISSFYIDTEKQELTVKLIYKEDN